MLLRGKPINHLLFCLAALLTLGFAMLFWMYHIWKGGERREMMAVDEGGVVTIWTAFDQDQASERASIVLYFLLIPWILLAFFIGLPIVTIIAEVIQRQLF